VKVILRAQVRGLGEPGAVVDVAPGYARNYLFPRGLAVEATEGNLALLEAERQREQRRRQHELDEARGLATRLAGQTVSIPAKAGEQGRLFGSVTSQDIAAALQKALGVVIDRRRILLDEPLKTVGEHTVRVRLHPEVEIDLRVSIVPA